MIASKLLSTQPAKVTFGLQLITSMLPENASGSNVPTFARTSVATVTDFEGQLKSIKSGEARFQGARRVENLLTYTEDFSNAAWAKSVGSSASQVSVTNPIGGSTCSQLVLGIGGKSTNVCEIYQQGSVWGYGDSYCTSCYVLGTAGQQVYLTASSGNSGFSSRTLAEQTLVTFTGVWQRVSITWSSTSRTNGNFKYFSFGTGGYSTNADLPAVTFNAWGAQLEKTINQFVQKPSEYVPVNSISYFPDTTLAPNIVTNGTFDVDASWVKATGYTISGGVLVGTGVTGGVNATQNVGAAAGKVYLVTFTVTYVTGGGTANVNLGTGGVARTALGTYSYYVVANGGTAYIGINGTASIDNITIQPVIHGSGVDGVRYFGYQNGNTVSGNVVTEAKGPAFDPVTTNKCTNYNSIPSDRLGVELTTNGTFDTSASWTMDTCWTISGGTANSDGSQSAKNIFQTAGIVKGKVYQITYTVSNYVSGGVSVTPGGYVYGATRSANGTYTDIVGSGSSATNQLYIHTTPTFIGSVDNISCREVIMAINTVARYDGTVFQNPIPNMTLAGGIDAILTVVDDTAQIAASGLSTLCPSGKVYRLQTFGTFAYVYVSGLAGDLNSHSLSMYARSTGSTYTMGFHNTGGSVSASIPITTNYTRFVAAGSVPVSSGNMFQISGNGTGVIYFVLNQLEENSTATAPIITQGIATARPTPLLGCLVEGTITNKCTNYNVIPPDTLGAELNTGSLITGAGYAVTNPDATHIVTWNYGGGARYQVDTTSPSLLLVSPSVMTIGRMYTITITSTIATGGLKCNIGTDAVISAGTFTYTAMAMGQALTVLRSMGNTDVTITAISIKEAILAIGTTASYYSNNWRNSITNMSINGSDTLGPEILTNPSFDSNTTGWNAYNSTLASVAGGQTNNCLQITMVSGTNQSTNTAVTTVVGTRYRYTVYVKSGTSGNEAGWIGAQKIDFSSIGQTAFTSSASWTMVTYEFVAVETTTTLVLVKNSTTAGTMLFDTASFKTITYPATLSIIDDTVQLSMDKLLPMCPSGKVYKLDNTLGTSAAFVLMLGVTANTNVHSMSIYARCIATGGWSTVRPSGGSPSGVSIPNTTYYSRVLVPNFVPANSQFVELRCNPRGYCILHSQPTGREHVL